MTNSQNNPEQKLHKFEQRHIGVAANDTQEMLAMVGCSTLDQLIEKSAPVSLLTKEPFDLRPALSETELLSEARAIASENQVFKSWIGQGYSNTNTPTVILRNILENPSWYTAYTPYQAEISQGRMEALLNFQTMVMDLTGMEMANASLLDEATAAAEAMALAFHASKKKNAQTLWVAQDVFSQTREVLETRAKPLGIQLKTFLTTDEIDWSDESFGLYVQNPSASGAVADLSSLCEKAKGHGWLTIVGCDILSLCLMKSPGEMGADIAIGSTQRFGVPMGFGGPHAAFMACHEEFKRLMPGRIIGVSKDARGQRALRLALQTREQHIRREKATSNICTAQVLLAVMASMYAVYHGPEGLKAIAAKTAQMTHAFATAAQNLGYKLVHQQFFDTVQIDTDQAQRIIDSLAARQINGFLAHPLRVSFSFDETTTLADTAAILNVLADSKKSAALTPVLTSAVGVPQSLIRTTQILNHEVFHAYHTETEMLRYISRLQAKDLTLAQSMIPLGSCTMKLNSTSEMIPVTWAEFSQIHPFAPATQTKGYQKLVTELEGDLCSLTGFAAVSLQPNAGSQGEYAGLLAIRSYHKSRNDHSRDICLIPSSAHGTNPASAVMAGMKVVVVRCDESGNIDIADLKAKAEQHRDQLAALMVTYPSTHGVFEAGIREICSIVHKAGGQVYMDGANMNALVGLIRPSELGADVCHLNLHKTFCIPHGGGGPGVGPIGVAAHLKPFLPQHRFLLGPKAQATAVSAAPYGSASILPISWAYIRMMGFDGLKRATQIAILNANYIAQKLKDHFPLLFTNQEGFVAHECILDLRSFKDSCGITADDVAKRLMDYGFHAPTMSWPVAGTLMIEPTESESKSEIDRFIDAMISIRQEIAEIESGKSSTDSNVLKNAPHTIQVVSSTEWPYAYTREKAAFPRPWVAERKFWPAVSRVDNAFGDKNLVCACS